MNDEPDNEEIPESYTREHESYSGFADFVFNVGIFVLAIVTFPYFKIKDYLDDRK